MRRLSGSRYYSLCGELPKPLYKVREEIEWDFWRRANRPPFHRKTTQTSARALAATIVNTTDPGVSGQCAQRRGTRPTGIRRASAVSTITARDQIPVASRDAAEAAAFTGREDGRLPSSELRKRRRWCQSGGHNLDYGADRQVLPSGQVSVCGDYQHLNLELSTMSSYEVEDIEPQEDGKPL